MGSVNTFTMISVLMFMHQAHDSKIFEMQVYPTLGVSPVDNARNEIVQEFLKGDCTHLFWIDSDTIPPMETLLTLLSHEKDIVSAITPIIEHDESRKDSDSNGFYKKWNCVGLDNAFVKPHTGLVPVLGAGGSCILVKRAVYEKMPSPWYRFAYNGDQCDGEDISFIVKARALGFEAFADTDLLCGHSKSIIW